MEFLRQLFHGKGYIDGITIINLDGEILFSAKLNSKFSKREKLTRRWWDKIFSMYLKT